MTVRQLSDYDFDGQCLGQDANDKIAFYGTTPVVQRGNANQGALTDSTGGTVDGTLADVTATYSQAILNNNFADVASRINEIRTVLVNLGLMKGSA